MVKRYGFEDNSDAFVEKPDGEYVALSDYESVRDAALEEAIAVLKSAKGNDKRQAIVDRIRALKGKPCSHT